MTAATIRGGRYERKFHVHMLSDTPVVHAIRLHPMLFRPVY